MELDPLDWMAAMAQPHDDPVCGGAGDLEVGWRGGGVYDERMISGYGELGCETAKDAIAVVFD